ncbi:hypothetical protein BJX61DRAFT_493137 [Aspergillus egyptiacus]|nr:hypothetical protein BJX61DRAFT_493137 [Aspergillus egyptiacus]
MPWLSSATGRKDLRFLGAMTADGSTFLRRVPDTASCPGYRLSYTDRIYLDIVVVALIIVAGPLARLTKGG